MKRFLYLIIILSCIVGTSILHQSVTNAENLPISQSQIKKIQTNCVNAQSTLNQLHASDALLRVNRGRLYELMSTKLMAPLNSRIALNRLDGSRLVSIAALYGEQLDSFRLKYKDYEESMTATLRTDCVKKPVLFYENLSKTRGKRLEVNSKANDLHITINKYKEEFELFAKEIQGSKR